jgi:hypothetical protein
MAGKVLLTVLALSILVGLGAAITADATIYGGKAPTAQMAILAVVFNGLAALMTPLSSAMGASTLMPIGGEQLHLGISPILVWLAAGCAMGLLAAQARDTIPAAILATGIAYISWLGLAIMVLPSVDSSIHWPLYMASMTSHIFSQAPLDLFTIFALPALSALTISLFEPLMPSEKPRTTEAGPFRRRFWEYEE